MLIRRSVPFFQHVHFLGFVVSLNGIFANSEKVRAIEERPEPKTIREVRSFYGLATYRRFIKEFNIVIAPITNCLKKCEFAWSNAAAKASVELRQEWSLSQLCLLDFSKIFEVACDTSDIGIGGVLAQEEHLVSYFSEKLNDAKEKYSTYNKEFYTVIQVLCYWRHLLPQEFVLFSDHKVLKYIYS